MPGNSSHDGVFCPNNPDSKEDLSELLGNVTIPVPGPGDFDYWWSVQTVPCFLLILLPLISLKSITFFTKFNSLGRFIIISFWVAFRRMVEDFVTRVHQPTINGGIHRQQEIGRTWLQGWL